LPVHLKAHVVSSIRPFASRNVLAMVEGSDTDHRRAEAVLYTGHYDHFGIDLARAKGDQIYHGAVDNGTGCGILLELARVWAGTKPAPPRSILFAAVTAEEQGLLGSEYLGKHLEQFPVQPILDLNYDALAPLGIPEEVEISGAERTTFYPDVEKIAKEFNLAIKPDAHPEAGHYYRSDHFSLGRVGIPAFSISEGLKFKGHDLAWGEAQSKDYVENHYHKPADTFVDSWDFTGDAKLAAFGYALGQAAASQPAEIKWLPGDEFEKAQKKLHARTPQESSLLEGTGLELTYYEPLYYPPLARATNTRGNVLLHVRVKSSGDVGEVRILQGHKLLSEPTQKIVSAWKFQSISESKSFDLTCEFVSGRSGEGSTPELVEFVGPGHVRIETSKFVINDPPATLGKKH